MSVLALIINMISWGFEKASAPDFVLKKVIASGSLEVVATAPLGHHFNAAAPSWLEDLQSKKKTAPAKQGKREAVFTLPLSAGSHPLEAFLYLCDDAKTFCEGHRVRLGDGAAR